MVGEWRRKDFERLLLILSANQRGAGGALSGFHDEPVIITIETIVLVSASALSLLL
jgi:hypothetical protein